MAASAPDVAIVVSWHTGRLRVVEHVDFAA
jgi:hypothetical protein